VEVAQPERIVLFGSAARGEMGPDSDLLTPEDIEAQKDSVGSIVGPALDEGRVISSL
jgi:hypothetical protein